MLEKLESQKVQPQWQKEEGQYIPYPSNYLNNERWDDDVTETISYKPKFTT